MGGRREEGVVGVAAVRRRKEVVLMVVVVVVFFGVMVHRWCLLHVEKEIWREEGGRGGRHAIAEIGRAHV